MTAEVHPQAGHLEAAGIAPDGAFALDRGHVEAAAPRQLAGTAQTRRTRSNHYYRGLSPTIPVHR